MTFLKYMGTILLIAIGLCITLWWPFLYTFILLGVVGYGVYLLHKTYPKTAKVIGSVVLIALIGIWIRTGFEKNFPVSKENFPWTMNYWDTLLAKKSAPEFSRLQTAIFHSLRDKGDELAEEIPKLIRAEKYEEVNKKTLALIDVQKKMNELQAQIDPPPAKPAKTVPSPQPVIELKKGDKRLYEINDNGYSPRIYVPDGVHYDLTPAGGKPIEVAFDSGQRFTLTPGGPYVNIPAVNPCIFRIYTKEKQGVIVEGN